WRAKFDKLAPDCIQQLTTEDGEKVDVWEAMCAYGKTSTFVYSNNMNSTKYCEVLKNLLNSINETITKRKEIHIPM
ncbi:unnamed protein product, partial [Rotaria magnacalcarata]